ncbi:hypothetical protein BU52_10510 [Streptomyces toyocaensis]|uniref:Uncharacterized protein n=1 Tax=Streptomyces toyocaensis TaxID=55952 RepID=A0A081XTZ9_STRTO|nr:hypothetical protein [Streptomyces toyocaensis]KES07022.1 hypothetical protein BU52_10510 [Streptomyces toyocaensis]
MPTSAKDLVEKVVKQRAAYERDQKAKPHPDNIRLLQIDADIALARSNLELAEALKASADARSRSSGALKDAVGALATKVTALTAKIAETGKR